jgi:hypothetical protein
MRFASLFMCLLVALNITAQDVSLDKKTDLVTVDGKPSFYIFITQKRGLGVSDYSLQNLEKKELASFSPIKGDVYNNITHRYDETTYLQIVFSKTGNSAVIKELNAFGVQKSLAKTVAKALLVKDNDIDAEAERNFIVKLKGVFLKDPNAPQINVTVNAPPTNASTNTPPSVPADISIKANNIYNNSELAGSFKKSISADSVLTIITYNKKDEKVATATYTYKNPDADWVVMFADGVKSSVLYNTNTPLEKLFKYFWEKGLLK